MFETAASPTKATSKVNAGSTRRVVVEPGDTGVMAYVGLHSLDALPTDCVSALRCPDAVV